jgi:hypothetical protein
MITHRRRVRAAAMTALAGTLLAVSSCSSSPKPPQSQSQVVSARHQQVLSLIVQCFVDQHVLTSAQLQDSQAVPPASSSQWIRGGHLTRNTAFAEWYRDVGAAVNVHGKAVDNWVTDVAYDPATWPSSICGSRPAEISAQPVYPVPGT